MNDIAVKPFAWGDELPGQGAKANGYRVEDLSRGANSLIVDFYREGTALWRWRAHIRAGKSGSVLAEASGAHHTEQGAREQAQSWFEDWRQ